MNTPRIIGVVNVTTDSFWDGGRYLEPKAALAHARALWEAGAYAVELGPASSHPDASPVSAVEEIRRLEPLLDTLHADGIRTSVDSYQSQTQAWALERGVGLLNDVQGFAEPSLYPRLAAADCRVVVMHSVQISGGATRTDVRPDEIFEAIYEFFDERIEALLVAGVDRDRLVIDPGMGFFLSSDPATSVHVLKSIDELWESYELPVLVSVSRKSFLGALTDAAAQDRGPATLAAELFAASKGVDYIRTHDVRALRDVLQVTSALTQPPSLDSGES